MKLSIPTGTNPTGIWISKADLWRGLALTSFSDQAELIDGGSPYDKILEVTRVGSELRLWIRPRVWRKPWNQRLTHSGLDCWIAISELCATLDSLGGENHAIRA
jgi:hypothetical protein